MTDHLVNQKDMPRRPEQFEKIREKSKRKILAAALELFANKGYGSTSIDSIAKKAGVSKGLIYNYYDNKKSILLAIYEDAMDQGEQMISLHKDNPNAHERLRAMIDLAFTMMTEKEKYIKLLMVISLQAGVLKGNKEFAKKMFKRNQGFIEAFSGDVKLKDPVQGLILDALIDGVMINQFRYGSLYPLQEIKDRIILEYCTPDKKTVKTKLNTKTKTK